MRISLVDKARSWVKKCCNDINSKDFTSIIDGRSFEWLALTLNAAESKGANIINLNEQ